MGLSVRRLVMALSARPRISGEITSGPFRASISAMCASSVGGSAHHAGDGLAKTAIGDRAAAMRRGDEDDPAHEGQWAEDENFVE